jgi:hypothetical protein
MEKVVYESGQCSVCSTAMYRVVVRNVPHPPPDSPPVFDREQRRRVVHWVVTDPGHYEYYNKPGGDAITYCLGCGGSIY